MMTMEQSEEERARLVTLYGAGARTASGKRAQAFARLYAQSEWTERAIAAVEKITQARVHYLLIFGQFLITTGYQALDLPERHFRALWAQTDKALPDAERFVAVRAMLEHEHEQVDKEEQPKSNTATRALAKQIIEQFSDGKFHTVRAIA